MTCTKHAGSYIIRGHRTDPLLKAVKSSSKSPIMAAYGILHLALLLLSITSQQVLAARQQDRHTISVQSLLSSSMCSSASAAPG